MKKLLVLVLIVILLLLNAATMYVFQNKFIPEAEIQAVEEYKDGLGREYLDTMIVARIIEGKSIEKYTVLSEDIIDENFEFIALPYVALSGDECQTKESLNGKVTKEELESKEIVLFSSLEENSIWFDDYDRMTEFPIKSDIAGTLMEGMIVDVIVTYSNGDYDVVLTKEKVLKLNKNVDVNGNLLSGHNERYEMIVSVNNEEDYRDMILAETMGKFEVRLYHDIKQNASKKTFDYEKMLAARLLEDSIVSGKSEIDNIVEDNIDEEVKEGQIIEATIEE